ncbi:MAG: HNH endonuclease [Bacteroidota bacterium]
MLPKPEILLPHLQRFSPSLQPYRSKYLGMFFNGTEKTMDHWPYICPMCISSGLLLLEDHYRDTGSEFTLDHFPPQSVGGKQTILVCKSCNNKAGLNFEGALKQKMEDISFDNMVGSSERKMHTKISAVDGRYAGLLSVRKDGTFGIDFKASSKVHAPLLDQWIENSKGDYNWTAEVSYFVADESKVSKSLLKIAYLYCFQYWGYGFVYSNTAENIRNILDGNGEYPLKNPSYWLSKAAKMVERFPLGLCTITAPNAFKCYCVNIVLQNKQTKHEEIACVILPGPSTDDWEKLKEYRAVFDNGLTLQVAFKHVEGFGISNDIFDGYEKSWQLLNSK